MELVIQARRFELEDGANGLQASRVFPVGERARANGE